MALHLGHRQSEDFDFFSNKEFNPGSLLKSVSYLDGARVDQRGDNTLSVVVLRGDRIKVAFFGGVEMGRIEDPYVVKSNGLQVASLIDLTATKLKTIQQRAEAKDYLDLAAALDAGVTLEKGLAAAKAIYGPVFNAIAALKALTYFQDGNLSSLPAHVCEQLRGAAIAIDLGRLPTLQSKPGICREREGA